MPSPYLIESLGCMGGFLGSSSMLAQVAKTIRAKSLHDFSWLMLFLSWFSSLLMFIYGLCIHRPVIYITVSINLLCISILLRYKYKTHSSNQTHHVYHLHQDQEEGSSATVY